MIDNATEVLKNLQEALRLFTREILDPFEAMIKNLNDHLQGQESSALIFKNWVVKNSLVSINRSLVSYTKPAKDDQGIKTIMDEIKMGVKDMVSIYDKIDSYKDQKKLAEYIGNITQPGLSGKMPINKKLADYAQSFKTKSDGNAIVEYYISAIEAVKQWSFPFAKQFLGEDTKGGGEDCFKSIISAKEIGATETTMILDHLKKINERIQIGFFEVGEKNRSALNEITCDTGFTALFPFYSWSYKDYKKEIYQLFENVVKPSEGEQKTVIEADIKRPNNPGYAFKFNSISIKFEFLPVQIAKLEAKERSKEKDRLNRKPEEDQERKQFETDQKDIQKKKQELDGLLKYLKISLTHSGKSYYQYGPKNFSDNKNSDNKNKVTYKILTTGLIFSQSFEVDHNGKPIIENAAKKIIEASQAVLSPYTSWQMKLEKTGSELPEKFFEKITALLESVAPEQFEMHLVGTGVCVDPNSKDLKTGENLFKTAKDLELDTFYGEYKCIDANDYDLDDFPDDGVSSSSNKKDSTYDTTTNEQRTEVVQKLGKEELKDYKLKDYKLIDNKGGGDCALYAIRDALKLGDNTNIKALREEVCRITAKFFPLQKLVNEPNNTDVTKEYKDIFGEGNFNIFKGVILKSIDSSLAPKDLNVESKEKFTQLRTAVNSSNSWDNLHNFIKQIPKELVMLNIDIRAVFESGLSRDKTNSETYYKHVSKEGVYIDRSEIDAYLMTKGYIVSDIEEEDHDKGLYITYKNVISPQKEITIHHNGTLQGGGNHWRAAALNSELQGNEESAQETIGKVHSYFGKYTLDALDSILNLRIIDLKLKNIKIMQGIFTNQEHNNINEILDGVIDANTQTILVPLNLFNKHATGLILEKSSKDILQTKYFDPENKPMPNELKQILDTRAISIEQVTVEQQKYSNCGPEVIEDFIFYLTGERLIQEEAIPFHSHLVEEHLLYESHQEMEISGSIMN
jgi:hypothetical protein